MDSVFDKIRELEEIPLLSKNEQLVKGIINAIDDKILIQGSKLPSVKNMAAAINFAAKTVAKGYKDLKDKGLVESRDRLGYFVVNEDTRQVTKVALLMYAFHSFQEVFYNTFRETLGTHIQVDVFFHHSNIGVMETILGNIKGQYGMYIVTPIPHPKTKDLLQDFPSNKLLLVDRFEKINGVFSHVTQEFERATYEALKELKEVIMNYKKIVLFFRSNSDYPVEVKRAFEQFIKVERLNGSVQEKYEQGSVVENTVYFTIGDGDLWKLLKDCKERNLEIGNDVGILSNNEGPVKEIICGGITTLSTDFKLMSKKAAEFVLNRAPIKATIPTKLIRRNSL
ncbi:MAG: GntR family transcriptional regulator [Bacteroidota bacterium]